MGGGWGRSRPRGRGGCSKRCGRSGSRVTGSRGVSGGAPTLAAVGGGGWQATVPHASDQRQATTPSVLVAPVVPARARERTRTKKKATKQGCEKTLSRTKRTRGRSRQPTVTVHRCLQGDQAPTPDAATRARSRGPEGCPTSECWLAEGGNARKLRSRCPRLGAARRGGRHVGTRPRPVDWTGWWPTRHPSPARFWPGGRQLRPLCCSLTRCSSIHCLEIPYIPYLLAEHPITGCRCSLTLHAAIVMGSRTAANHDGVPVPSALSGRSMPRR